MAGTMPHVNVGTIGHHGHGKTTLTAAITQVLMSFTSTTGLSIDQIDKEKEEKTRGMTINANHVEYITNARHYAHVDCPGSVDYAKNMVAGAAQMDGAILVVSAPDGIGAQTREHLLLARQAGINHILIFLNKCDLVDEGRSELIELEIRDQLTKYKFDGDNCPFIRGSALRALEGDEGSIQSIKDLMDAVDSYIPAPDRSRDMPFLMPVADTFTITGSGTVASGRIERGTVKVGDEVEVLGLRETIKTVVTGIETFKTVLEEGVANDYVSLMLDGVKQKDVSRGQALAKPHSVTPHAKFEAEMYVLPKEDGGRHTPFNKNFKPQFYIGTAVVTGSIHLPEEVREVMPGDNVRLEVTLAVPVVMQELTRFSMRESDITVAVGVVVKIL